MTAIDLLAGKPLTNIDSMGILSEFPTLQANYKKIRCLPSFNTAYDVEELEDCEECMSYITVPAEAIPNH